MGSMMTGLMQTMRRLLRTPGFTAVVVATLALGIGLTASVFQLLNAVVLRPLPYPASERLVAIAMVDEDGRTGTKVSAADVADWRERTRSFREFAVLDFGTVAVSAAGGEPETARSAHASPSIFSVLGVTPAIGRAFGPENGVPGGDDVVMLSHGFWQRRFGGADVRGETLLVQGRPHTIIGVLGRDFEDPASSEQGMADVWLPLAFADLEAQRGSRWLSGLARLEPDASIEQASADLNAVALSIADLYPDTNEGLGARALSLREAIWGEARLALVLLLAGAGFVLLIACANLTNLVFARSTTRQREVAIRRAMGAGRGHVVREILLENALLALFGGVTGLGVALGIARVLRVVLGESLPRFTAPPDFALFVFVAGVTLVAGLFVGTLPAFQAMRTDANAVLKESGRGTMKGRHSRRLRNLLVGGQVAFAFVLLIGAALMLRSFERLTHVDPGFVTEDAVTFELILPSATYAETERVLAFESSLIQRLSGVPGVSAAGAVDKMPFGTRWGCNGFAVEGRPIPERLADWSCAESRAVTPDYADAMGIALLQGRMVAEGDDPSSAPVVVVNESFAAQMLEGDALGQRIAWARETDTAEGWRTVVGVVADVHHRGLDTPPSPEIWMPYRQAPDRRMSYVVRAENASQAAVMGAVRTAVAELDASLPPPLPRSLESVVAGSLEGVQTGTYAVAGLGTVALLLALLGIYGVLAYFIAQRVPEFGLRAALGASRRDLVRLVMTEGLRTVAIGCVVGLIASLALTRVMRGLLYGVSATDPVAFVGVPLLLVAVAALACWVPARRAAVDPAAALRGD